MLEEGKSDRVVVLGVGNVLMGDDGLGPYVVALLEARYEFPAGVEVIDGGTPGLDFLPYLQGTRAVIIVDTISSSGRPGEVRLYPKQEFFAKPMPPRVTPHQPGIREAMMAAEMTDSAPGELLLVGVVPGNMELATELTPEVQGAVEAVIEEVMRELDRLGVPARRRGKERVPNLWWQTAR